MKERFYNQRNLTRKLRQLLVLFALLLLPICSRAYTYIEFDKVTRSSTTKGINNGFTVVYSSTTSMGTDGEETWYIVTENDITIQDRITVSGNVHLILCDGTTLTAVKGITVPSGSSLSIYAQSGGNSMGALIASAYSNPDQSYPWGSFGAAIGGVYTVDQQQTSTSTGCGAIYIHGGRITADASNQTNVTNALVSSIPAGSSAGIAAGIGGCGSDAAGSDGGTVEIYGGTVTATGSSYGAGIGGGLHGQGGNVHIYGGNVTAAGGSDSAQGIGAGYNGGDSGTLMLEEYITCFGDDNNSNPTGNAVTGSKDNVATRYRYMKTIESYGLTVGGVVVSRANASDILGDGTTNSAPTASYVASTNTLTLNGINVGTTATGNYIVSNLQKLNVDLLGDNNIGCTGAAIYNNYNGASLHFKSTDTYSGNLYVLNGGTVYNGFLDANVSFDTELIYNATSNSIVTQFYELWVGHEDLYVTIKNKDNIIPPYGITLGTDGKVSYDSDNHVLTLKNATIEGIGIKWDEAADLTINLIGTNFVNTIGEATISSISASGQTAATPSLTFKQGDNNDCSLVINCATGKKVIDGFNLQMDTGLQWTENAKDGNNNVTKATVAVDYGLSVGETSVTNVNALDVLGDGNVSYDKANNTLTLNDGTTLNGAIWYGSNLPNQTIVLNGTISVTNSNGNYAIYTNSGNITFKKGTGVTNAELTATCGPGYNPIERNSISLGDGLYWKPLAPGATSNTTVITDKPGFILVEGSLFADGQTFNGATGTITYNENDKTLTFTNYSGDFTSSNAIETGIEGLKIKLVGDNVITFENTPGDVAFKGIQPNASIQFIKEGNATMTITDVTKAIDGFTAGNVTYENLICYESGNSEWSIRKISKPQLSAAVNGTDNFTYATIDYDPADKSATSNEVVYASLSPKLKYSFDYADANLSDITGADYPNGGIKMTSPGVLTAWVEVGTVKSEEVTGVRFGLTEDVIKTLYDGAGQQTISMNLEPAGRLSDVDISLLNNPTWVTSFNQSTKELTVTGCGMSNFSLSFTLNKTATSSFAVLGDDGDNVKFAIEVLPPAPTIAFDANKTYLSTDEIEITGINNTTIFYTWGDAVIGKNYTHSADVATLMEYNGTGVPAQTGTLRTWAGYLLSGNTYVLSEVASQAFTVKKDIASCTVTLPTRATYTGDAYEPVVYETATSTSPLTLGTDYTVSYKKTDGETATDVGSMVDAGTYKITITGKGDFGGTKDITGFQIGQANLANAAISKLTVGNTDYTGDDIKIQYTGEAIHPTVVVTINYGLVTVDASEYTVSYGDNNTNVSGVDKWATVKVTSTGKNFTASTFASKDFKIVAAPVTITAANQTVTYNATQQAYSSATVDNANATLAIAYYTNEDDRARGSYALTGAPTNTGTYYVKVSQTNSNYTAEAQDATFTIDQLDIASAVITLDNTELDYNGTQQTVNVTKVMVGDIEVPADNYEISENVATAVGEHTITITAKTQDAQGAPFANNFKGSATTTFNIVRAAATVNFAAGQQYIIFYSADEDFNLPAGTTAYIITDVSNNTVVTKQVTYIKKGTPILIENATGQTITESTDADFNGNLLKYAPDPVDASGKEFVLYKDEFVKATGTIPGGKSYLEVNGTNAARSLSIAHGGSEVAGINDVTLDEDSENEQWYDLQGRKIEKPTKTGIYIVNGKKKVINIK